MSSWIATTCIRSPARWPYFFAEIRWRSCTVVSCVPNLYQKTHPCAFSIFGACILLVLESRGLCTIGALVTSKIGEPKVRFFYSSFILECFCFQSSQFCTNDVPPFSFVCSLNSYTFTHESEWVVCWRSLRMSVSLKSVTCVGAPRGRFDHRTVDAELAPRFPHSNSFGRLCSAEVWHWASKGRDGWHFREYTFSLYTMTLLARPSGFSPRPKRWNGTALRVWKSRHKIFRVLTKWIILVFAFSHSAIRFGGAECNDEVTPACELEITAGMSSRIWIIVLISWSIFDGNYGSSTVESGKLKLRTTGCFWLE